LVFSVRPAAQSHNFVPVENQIYSVLEQAEMRGLCAPLPGERPYLQTTVLKIVNEILAAKSDQKYRLSDAERAVLENYRVKFSKSKPGIDDKQDAYGALRKNRPYLTEGRMKGAIGAARDSGAAISDPETSKGAE
jgi:hypothetical protein